MISASKESLLRIRKIVLHFLHFTIVQWRKNRLKLENIKRKRQSFYKASFKGCILEYNISLVRCKLIMEIILLIFWFWSKIIALRPYSEKDPTHKESGVTTHMQTNEVQIQASLSPFPFCPIYIKKICDLIQNLGRNFQYFHTGTVFVVEYFIY